MDKIITSCEITCSKCLETTKAILYDEDQFAEDLHNAGWKATGIYAYCPKCKPKKRVKK